ncbi:MAG: CRTAC1 family protein [Bryobacteraceae bacterium]
MRRRWQITAWGTIVTGILLLSADIPQPAFVDIAKSAGIDVVVRSGTPDKKYLMETVTGGVCLLDYDNDGKLDIYFVNGSNMTAYLASRPGYGNRLYHNNGDGTFTDVTVKAGVGGGIGWGMGCSAADYNNDGFEDLYVTNLGRNILYRNNRDGTFTDIGKASHTDHLGWSTGSTWGDFDGDGRVDLYVANYVDFDFKNPPQPGRDDTCKYLGIDIACGPRGLNGAQGVLFHNNGDGTFSDQTELRGLKTAAYYSLGACAVDYDNDGDLDIFVANDSTPNFLFQNQGDGTFKEVAMPAGVAYNEDGNAQAGMGVDFADYDNDGWLDGIITVFARDTNTVFHNESRRNGKVMFSDATTRAGQRDSYPYMSWGVGFVDFDNDGLRDIYVVNGHLYPQIDALKNEMGYRQNDLFYQGIGGGRFQNVSTQLRHPKHVGRGAAFGDLNNDGRMDVVISNLDDRPNVLMNHQKNTNHWIVIRCIGTISNRDAIGARVAVTTESGTQIGDVKSGCSYLSSSDQRVHFGLGRTERIQRLAIRWPSGKKTEMTNVSADQILQVHEPSE